MATSSLRELLQESCCLRPHAPAARSFNGAGTLDLSYQILYAKAGQLQDRLLQHCSGGLEHELVAVYLERSIPLVLAVHAIVLAGAAYLPLDTSASPARLAEVLTAAQPGCILWADSDHGGSGPLPEGIGHTVPTFQLSAAWDDVMPDAAGLASSEPPAASCAGRAQLPEDACYVLPTSGSSGAPKLVVGTAAGVLNRCCWFEAQYGRPQRMAFATSPAFVDHVWQLLGALLSGACIVVVPPSLMHRPKQLGTYLLQTGVTHMTSIPRTWQQLCDAWLPGTLPLQVAISSGEPVRRSLMARMQLLAPQAAVLNLWGCTEAAADSTCWQLPADGAPEATEQPGDWAPAGWPVANTGIVILDTRESQPELKFAKVGQLGEVCIFGEGLCAGHLRAATAAPANPSSEASFAQLPSSQLLDKEAAVLLSPGLELAGEVCIFRTRDMGRITAEGLSIHGRLDLQVKVNGVSVNLQALEQALEQVPGVAAAACKHGNHHGLTAFIQPAASTANASYAQLVAACAPLTKGAPMSVCFVPELPRSPAGKLLRSSLDAALKESGQALQPHVKAPQNVKKAPPGELQILNTLCRALQARLEPAQDMFAAGMSSCAAAVAAAELDIAAELLYAYTSARQLARFLASGQPAPALEHGDEITETGISTPVAEAPLTDADAESAPMQLLSVPKALNGGEGKSLLSPNAASVKGWVCNGGCGPIGLNVLSPPSSEQLGSSLSKLVGRSEGGQQPSTAGRGIRCLWRRKLLQCVDAAPAVFIAASTQDQIPPIGVHRTAVADASPCTALHEPDAGTSQATSDLHSPSAALPTPHTAQQQGSSGSAACNAQPSLPSLCYSCSHGGDVLCMELATGALVWSQHLPGRTAPGLCLHPHMLALAVACTEGQVFMLDPWTGAQTAVCDLHSRITSGPAVDPWQGHFWIASHNALTALEPTGRVVRQEGHGGPFSSSPVFSSSRQRLYVAGLHGQISCFQMPAKMSPTAAMQIAGFEALRLEIAWSLAARAPILVSPAVDEASGSIICSTVQGQLLIICSEGRILQHIEMCSLSSPALVTTQLDLTPSSAQPGRAYISCSDGLFVCLDLQQYTIRWRRQLAGPCQGLARIMIGDAATSVHLQSDPASGYADPAPSLPKRARSAPRDSRTSTILACTDSGAVNVVCPDSGTDIVAPHKLPGAIFCQPVAVGGMALAGCRDDCLYRLEFD